MRVGFDTTPVDSEGAHRSFPAGIRRVVGEVVARLEARGRLEVLRLARPAAQSNRRWLSSELPRRARDLELIGVHSFLSSFAWRGPGRRVQTIHELPWRHGAGENADLKHRLWATLGPLRADRVLTATEHTARDLMRWRLPGAGAVRVLPWGVGPPFGATPPGSDRGKLAPLDLPPGPFVLCPGAVRPKKNLAASLHGLAELGRRGARVPGLVVTGAHGPQLDRDLELARGLGLARQVCAPGVVDDEELAALLHRARCVAVLSPSEGFSLPVLEALACGTPAVVPGGSAQAEVAGPEALLVDPGNPSSVASGFERAGERREALRGALIERAAQFSWDRCAAAIEDLWRELAP